MAWLGDIRVRVICVHLKLRHPNSRLPVAAYGMSQCDHRWLQVINLIATLAPYRIQNNLMMRTLRVQYTSKLTCTWASTITSVTRGCSAATQVCLRRSGFYTPYLKNFTGGESSAWVARPSILRAGWKENMNNRMCHQPNSCCRYLYPLHTLVSGSNVDHVICENTLEGRLGISDVSPQSGI